jgi:hypothetical protein
VKKDLIMVERLWGRGDKKSTFVESRNPQISLRVSL